MWLKKIKIFSILLVIMLLCSCNNKVLDNSQDSMSNQEEHLVEDFPNIEVEYLDTEIVRVKDFIPNIVIDLRYASTRNFTNEVIYDFNDAYLRYGTILKLKVISDKLNELGYKLLIWDAYRPHSAQFKLWSVFPDAIYVSNPNVKYSSHSNGGTVDISIVSNNEEEVEMPSEFDEFNKLADRDYTDVSLTAKNNALLLQELMEDNGFVGYYNEWWHYSDTTEYEYEDIKDLNLPKNYEEYLYVTCDSVELKNSIKNNSIKLIDISKNSKVKLLGLINKFSHIQYKDKHGYLLSSCLNYGTIENYN